jgi:hypothetical protein
MQPRLTALCAGLAVAALGAPSPVGAQDTRGGGGGVHMTQVQGHEQCYCRAQGRTFAVGESACLRTAAGPRVAECGMVLNNTSWRFTEQPCPES